MYQKIMVPIDLAHIDRLGKALKTASDFARQHDIGVCYVGVSMETPSSVAHNPKEYGEKLAAFAKAQRDEFGIETTAKPLFSHDLATDLDRVLIKAIDEIGADLVIMASHMPGLAEHFITSNAGYIATHAKVSVFVVR
ncbi:MAG: universal stress protein [Pseudomonadota bacterium]